MNLAASIDLRPLLGRFDRLRKRDQRRVFSAARKPLRDDLRRHAKDQADERGKWPKRAASTIERLSHGRRRGGRGRLLKRLPFAIRITSGPMFVRAQSLVRWSNVHNKGGTAGRGARIRRRRFMYASRALKRDVKKMLRAALLSQWKRQI